MSCSPEPRSLNARVMLNGAICAIELDESGKELQTGHSGVLKSQLYRHT